MNNSIYNVSPVTAQSLEKIHTLADRPTRERRGRAPSRPPLVLYIFKIPGRSEFCLSTHKPLSGIITAEDITQSLYIVHVETAEEVEERRAVHEQISNRTQKITRKPVPPPRSAQQPTTTNLNMTPSVNSGGSFLDDVASRPRQQHTGELASKRKTTADIPINTIIRNDSATGSAKHVARFLDPDHPYSKPFERRSRLATSDIFLDILNPHYKAFGQTVNYCGSSDGLTFTRRIWSEEGLVRRDERPSKFEDELDHRRSMNLTSDWHSSSQDVRAHIAPRFHRFGARAGAGYVFQSPWTSDDFFVFSTNRRGNSMECHLSSQVGGNLLPEVFASSELRFNFPMLPSSRPSSMATSDLQTRRESMLSLSRLSMQFGGETFRVDSASRPSRAPAEPVVIRRSFLDHSSSGRRSGDSGWTGSNRLSFTAFKKRLTNMTNESTPDPSATNDYGEGLGRDGRMDLSLAKERLGGGLSGDKVKLAKLIINDRGQDLLELLVASNMALFLRAFHLMNHMTSDFR